MSISWGKWQLYQHKQELLVLMYLSFEDCWMSTQSLNTKYESFSPPKASQSCNSTSRSLTTAKLDVLEQVAIKNKATVILLQEPHKENDAILNLPGFTLIGHNKSKHHGLATFIKKRHVLVTRWTMSRRCQGWVDHHKSARNHCVNVYKPPPSRLEQCSLPDSTAPAVYAGDFNSWHNDWGFKHSTQDGEFLAEWFSSADTMYLFDPKEPYSFISGCWNTETNSDLAFVKVTGMSRCQYGVSWTDSLAHNTARHWSQCHHWSSRQRESLSRDGISARPTGRTLGESSTWQPRPCQHPTPPTYDVYEAYCKMLTDATKKHVLRVSESYVPCWDEMCEELLERPQRSQKQNCEGHSCHRNPDPAEHQGTREVDGDRRVDQLHPLQLTSMADDQQADRPGNQTNTLPDNRRCHHNISNGRFLNADKSFPRKTTGKVNYARHSAPTSTSQETSRTTRWCRLSNTWSQTKLLGSTTSTRNPFCTRALKPHTGYVCSAPSVSVNPSSWRYGHAPRSSLSSSQINQWMTQRDTDLLCFSACHTRSWNGSCMHALTRW